MKSLVGEAYITLSCLGGNYSFMISTNQNVIYIDNIKCQINESFFSKNKRVNLNHKVTFRLNYINGPSTYLLFSI